MSSTLIIIAYAFPPENVSGAARPYRFYRYLPECGVSPVVVTASVQPEPREGVVVVPDDARELGRRSWSWQLERVIRKTLLPGEEGLTWSGKAAREARRIAAACKGPVAILSTSPPFTTHVAALRARRRGIPWIADFRDPMHKPGESRGTIHSRLESRFLRGADAVIANTDRAADALRTRYGGLDGKLVTIWNGFDPEDAIRAAPLPPREGKRLVHVGELYTGRHPGPLLSSARRLIASGALAPGRMRFAFIGPAVEDEIPDLETLRELAAAGIVDYRPGRVPQAEARRHACEADGLVLLQPQSDTQVPAKLFEYVRIGRPVLAYLRRDSPSERILALSGTPHVAVYTDDGPAEVDAKLLAFLDLPSGSVEPSEAFARQFNARDQAQALARLVTSLAG